MTGKTKKLHRQKKLHKTEPKKIPPSQSMLSGVTDRSILHEYNSKNNGKT
ncbi:hypothetical protein LU293_01685 [Moraxella nasovis]|nr:hypothetical protein [Moraxella nasovis]UNU73649.1 hypothetical protein LU293_01685 [Moraxella nasovis]